MMTLLILLEGKFNLHDDFKVPRELLKFDLKVSNDSEYLLSSYTVNKAKRMRQEIFQILKRVQEFKILDRK
jgi:hypothetical protein